MENFLIVDLNLLSSVFVWLVFLYTSKQIYNKSQTIILLKNTIYLGIIGSLAEVAFFLVNSAFGLTSEFQYILKYVLLMLNLIIPILMVTYFTRFIRTFVLKEITNDKVAKWFLFIPSITSSLLILTNPLTNFVFSLDKNTLDYTRETGFLIYFVLFSFYIMYNIFFVLRNKKKLLPEEVIIFILTNLFPVISTAIQTLTNCKYLIIWNANAIGLITILIYMNRKITRYDILTQAWTRYSFEDLIINLQKKNIQEFSIAAIDVKNLKEVNKRFGYAEGNNVLQKMFKILKRTIRTTNIIARYRQNEFLVVFFTKDMNILKKEFQNIRRAFDLEFSFNMPNLDYYFYCEPFDLNKYKTYSNFIRQIEKNLIEINELHIK